MASPHLWPPALAPAATFNADISSPPSPTTMAAALTLEALSSSRPPTIDDDGDEFEDDDDGGGVSITSADLHHFTAANSLSDTHMADDDVTAAFMSAIDHIYPDPFTSAEALEPLQLPTSYPPFHIPNLHIPPPPIFSSHLSSSEQSLEPPPTLQEAHLSIQDKASFAPITSFFHLLAPGKRTVPGLDLIQLPDSITRDDLQGDRYDYQGIDWRVRDTTREQIRAKRENYEKTKVPRSVLDARRVSDLFSLAASSNYLQHIAPTSNKDSFFQFKRNNTSHRAFFPHFQLRNVLAASSRNDVYYAAGHRVFRTDADGSPSDVIIDLSKRLASDGSITTVASSKDVLIAGAFEGEYAITDLSSTYDTPCTFGRTSDFAADAKSRIVNHMHLFDSRRTYQPQAVLCSNDHRLRVLDCATNTFTHSFLYPAAVNSAATSPDGRMRVVVGDFQETLITNAETGRPFETLASHTDDAFACAWADDGIHVATAAQDSTIVIWDARNWGHPLKVMMSELSVPRSLRFSPIGSGPRVLISAEADDYINVINAQTFDSKQVFDFFGGIGGVAFTPDGQSLFVANGERRFGGIIELERTGWADRHAKRRSYQRQSWSSDWGFEADLTQHQRVMGGHTERERRNVDLGDVFI